ncbi:MAG: retropepsin-like aspartic protease [Polaribacter sp.]|uniref:retropepsin-like aspartic protease n=1 Tax=Polaribacter sp. TaxID=1920175 RepID=UPI002621414B|nr:retropepsin-like aspartic protease [uncultured Polaribacter sp.]
MKKLLLLLTFIPYIILAQNPETAKIKKMANLGQLVSNEINDTIPIKIYNDMIVIEAKLNGKPMNFMWDNGFSFSAIDKSLSEKITLKKYKEKESISATDAVNNQVKLDLKIAHNLSIKNHQIKDSPFLLIDINTLTGGSIDIQGIIGATVIKKLNWNFNFDENYVVVSQKEFQKDGMVMPFKLDLYNRMFTSLELNGITNGVEIDFGSNSDEIDLTIKAIGLFKNTKKSKYEGISAMSVSGIAKPSINYSIKDFSYKIGGITFKHPIKIFLTNDVNEARIGNKMLRHYNCIVNSNSNQIILTERETNLEESPKKSFGFIIVKIENKLTIAGKWNNPNITKYNALNLGDKITQINGKKAEYFHSNSDLRAFQIDLLKNNKELIINTEKGESYTLLPKFNIYE